MIRLLLLLTVLGYALAEDRPATWAQPVTVEGVHNLFQVAPGLYRCAQPEAAGMAALQRQLGVRTVINLRAFHDDGDETAGTAIQREELAVKTWHMEDEDVIRVLRVATDPAKAPVLIHCQHGSDRTGCMCAMYRVVVQGWSKEDAIREMVEGGYGFWKGWTNIVRYVREADVPRLRAAVNAGR